MHGISYCVKSFGIRSYSGSYFLAFGLNTERYSVSLRIYSECGKIRTRITPNRNTLRSVILAQKISNTFFFPRAFLCHNCQNNAQCQCRLVPIIFTNWPTRLDKNTKKCCQEQTLTSIAKEKLCDKKMEESFLINRWCHAHFPILHKIQKQLFKDIIQISLFVFGLKAKIK